MTHICIGVLIQDTGQLHIRIQQKSDSLQNFLTSYSYFFKYIKKGGKKMNFNFQQRKKNTRKVIFTIVLNASSRCLSMCVYVYI